MTTFARFINFAPDPRVITLRITLCALLPLFSTFVTFIGDSSGFLTEFHIYSRIILDILAQNTTLFRSKVAILVILARFRHFPRSTLFAGRNSTVINPGSSLGSWRHLASKNYTFIHPRDQNSQESDGISRVS